MNHKNIRTQVSLHPDVAQFRFGCIRNYFRIYRNLLPDIFCHKTDTQGPLYTESLLRQVSPLLYTPDIQANPVILNNFKSSFTPEHQESQDLYDIQRVRQMVKLVILK